MTGKHFVDTNVLINAYDKDADSKHEQATALLRSLWEGESGILSTQVLQEFYVNITRKIPHPVSPATVRGIIETYRAWQIETNDLDTVLRASEYQERHLLSFWDAMIVAAAVRGGATTLLTEDLTHGQVVEGIEVKNPFLG